jgi:hypothetical protein
MATRFRPQNAKAIVSIVEGNAFEQPGEDFRSR